MLVISDVHWETSSQSIRGDFQAIFPSEELGYVVASSIYFRRTFSSYLLVATYRSHYWICRDFKLRRATILVPRDARNAGLSADVMHYTVDLLPITLLPSHHSQHRKMHPLYVIRAAFGSTSSLLGSSLAALEVYRRTRGVTRLISDAITLVY